MLILTRRTGESLILNDDIEILILANSHGQVRLGIDAPKETTIHRKEIYDKILRVNNIKSVKDAPIFERKE